MPRLPKLRRWPDARPFCAVDAAVSMLKAGFNVIISVVSMALLGVLLPVEQAWPGNSDGLPTALNFTIHKHPAVSAKLEELNSLGYEINSAAAGRYPSLSIQAQSMRNDQSQLMTRLQQPLWAGGRIDGGINLAQMKRRAAQASLLQIRRQLMEETAATYAQLAGARQRLHAAEMNVNEHEKLLGLISRRQSGSIASEADVRLARSRLTQAQGLREQLRGLVDTTLNDLLALTQVPLEGLVTVEEEVLLLPDPATILQDAETVSPLVQQRLLEVEVARGSARLRAAEMLPTLSAQIERDIVFANDNGTLPEETRIGIALAGNVEGLGFAGIGRVKAAEALVAAAKREVETARNEVRRRTRAFVSDRNMFLRLMESNELLVVDTKETLDSFMRQYDAGRKSWVDVLNAQQELADARQAMEQTKSSLLELTLRLGVVIGRLDSYAGL